jgi:hypothetical protein
MFLLAPRKCSWIPGSNYSAPKIVRWLDNGWRNGTDDLSILLCRSKHRLQDGNRSIFSFTRAASNVTMREVKRSPDRLHGVREGSGGVRVAPSEWR